MFGGYEIEAVVFDLDGTLIHTTVDFRRMKERLLSELAAKGVPPSLTDPRDTIVANLARAVDYLRSQRRDDEEKELRDRVGRSMDVTEMERVEETVAVEGAQTCLSSLRTAGLRTAILTRGSRLYATSALRYAGLDGFDTMVCRDDFPEEEAKPNGLSIDRTAALLGVPASRCLVVGDHLMDWTCARSRSAPFIGVLTGSFRRPDWDAAGGPPLIGSVAELPAQLGLGNGK